ncbi:PREDICTED: translin isoform X2 [Nelumbo nucifera]|uniref:Translin isoform X2 n=1 Tax=Nelumbo nucifera TaxID=4432 RepID=A0A1U7ZZ08_NELNU|nr:PREDICTED: translin isoform X2 [Nelumbo nucifera]
MKLAFRNAFFSLSHSLIPNTSHNLQIPLLSISAIRASPSFPLPSSVLRNERVWLFCAASDSSSSMASVPNSASLSSSVEKQFEEFRLQLEASGSLRERIRAVSMEIESVTRLMHSSILFVHQSRPVPEVLEKAKVQIGALKELFHRIAEIIRECPSQYYRYHGDWRTETQTVVSLLAFMHWLETGNLLMHKEAEEKLGLNSSDFGLDVEDYLIGICFMSNELPRYVVNQVTAGDYDCPRNVVKFLTDLHAAFRMLNLRNDFLRKKFDGMKYDLRRVEEVYYDVKIRGLTTTENTMDDNGAQE